MTGFRGLLGDSRYLIKAATETEMEFQKDELCCHYKDRKARGFRRDIHNFEINYLVWTRRRL
jgi:hypothetical protein